MSVLCCVLPPCAFVPCEANITVLPKPTIFGWAIKFVQNVGSHETLCLSRVVAHDQVFRLRALIVDVHFQSVSFVLALYIFRHYMFQYSFVSLVLGVHKVSVKQMMLGSGVFIVTFMLIKLVELVFYFFVDISIAVTVVYQKLFYSCEFLVHGFICRTGASCSSDKCPDDTGFVARWTFAVCI